MHECEILKAINSLTVEIGEDYTLEELYERSAPILHPLIELAFSAGSNTAIYDARMNDNKTTDELDMIRKRAHVAVGAIRSDQGITTREFVEKYVGGVNENNLKDFTQKVIQQTSGNCIVKDWLIEAIEAGMKENSVKIELDIRNG